MVEATTRDQTPAAAGQAPWYGDKRRLLTGVVLTLAVVVAAGWVLWTSDRRKEDFAARSLNQARSAAEAGNLPLAASELQRLIETYRGTDAATEAVITLNQVRMVNGQGELAVVGLREFLATNPARKYQAPANALLGTALEGSSKPGEAAQAYTKASEAAEQEFLKTRYLIDAARAYRNAGKTAEAVTAYRTIIEKFPESTGVTEAKVRLSELTDGKM